MSFGMVSGVSQWMSVLDGGPRAQRGREFQRFLAPLVSVVYFWNRNIFDSSCAQVAPADRFLTIHRTNHVFLCKDVPFGVLLIYLSI